MACQTCQHAVSPIFTRTKFQSDGARSNALARAGSALAWRWDASIRSLSVGSVGSIAGSEQGRRLALSGCETWERGLATRLLTCAILASTGALSSTVPRRGSQEADVGVGSKIEAVDVPTAGPTSVEAGYDSPKPNQVDAVAETSGNGAGPAQAFAGSATGSALSGSASPAPSTPSSSYLPLPPLPIEVFLRVMQYLEPVDVVSSRRVSSLWCNSINGEPRLWRDLTCSLLDDVTDQLELYSRYARPRAAGQTGGVTNLTVVLEGTAQPQGYVGDLIPTEFAVHAFKRLVHLLAEFAVTAVKAEHGVLARQGGTRLESSLRTLRVNLEPQSQVSIWVLHVLSRLRTHPLFGQLERSISTLLDHSHPSMPLLVCASLTRSPRQLGHQGELSQFPARRQFPQHVPNSLAPFDPRVSAQIDSDRYLGLAVRGRGRQHPAAR